MTFARLMYDSLSGIGTAPLAAALVNHLWQSTGVTLIAWLFALVLRRNQARMRYWVWMIASVKFLIPFSLLVAAGKILRAAAGIPAQRPALPAVMGRITQPYPAQSSSLAFGTFGAAPGVVHPGSIALALLITIWLAGSCTVALSWARSWRQIRRAVRTASPVVLVSGLQVDVPVLSTSRLLEPGVFGILRPVLLLPQQVTAQLSEKQLGAILAHEMCHIRRRDNLTAAIHMVVAAAFWFHPAVWWIKARLLEERERACDEAVLESGNDAELYAESILNVCRFYAASPLPCVSGVTGSNLKQRIVRIMTEGLADEISLGRKLVLVATAVVVVAVPVALGLLSARRVSAQAATAPLPSFEVASIRPVHSGQNGMSITWKASRYDVEHSTMKPILWAAFRVHDYQILGAPGWVNNDQYEINAKIDDSMQKLPPEEMEKQLSLMLQSLLIDRCKLKFHRITKEVTVYRLVAAKNGPKLVGAAPDEQFGITVNNTRLTAKATTMSELADQLSAQLNRTVINGTELKDKYDMQLTYASDQDQPAPGYGQSAAQPDAGPSIFTAMQDQLGLKLVAEKGPVEMIVIDHIEPPSPN